MRNINKLMRLAKDIKIRTKEELLQLSKEELIRIYHSAMSNHIKLRDIHIESIIENDHLKRENEILKENIGLLNKKNRVKFQNKKQIKTNIKRLENENNNKHIQRTKGTYPDV